MGSFNVACSVSRISLSVGMPTVYLPLELSKFHEKIENPINSLIYPWCYYSPYTLPIFGEYGDYGRIENIEKDENVKWLEEWFQCPIEDITENRGKDKEGNPKFSSQGMFVHREIWDVMIKKQTNEYGEIDGERKNSEWFGNWSKTYLKKQYSGLRKQLTEEAELHKKIQLCKNEELIGLCIKANMFRTDSLRCNIFSFDHYNRFMDIYKEKIIKGRLFKELMNLRLFEVSMTNCNVHYFPAANGCQFGNYKGHKYMAEKVVQILNKKIREEKNG